MKEEHCVDYNKHQDVEKVVFTEEGTTQNFVVVPNTATNVCN